ncbi:MAG: hypothetical protein D3916_09390 [Candidatus Electrothrix sp. MAN1_4]|nr:hypothetical protein [Candidatus Electrothrix sp. MAN1_4]
MPFGRQNLCLLIGKPYAVFQMVEAGAAGYCRGERFFAPTGRGNRHGAGGGNGWWGIPLGHGAPCPYPLCTKEVLLPIFI